MLALICEIILSAIFDGSFNCLILLIVSEDIFLLTVVSFSNLFIAVKLKGSKSSSFDKISFWYSNEHYINLSSYLKSTILTLLVPSTNTLTVPSGSFSNCKILLSHP